MGAFKFKWITIALYFFVIAMCNAQESKDKELIKNTISEFFTGLQSGDTTAIAKVVSPNLKLQTTFIDKNNRSVLNTSTKEDFFIGVSKKKVEDIWYEKLISVEIRIDLNLASVWAPYEFYLNSEFSHCGSNSFQLFKNEGKWQIIYLVDSRKRNGCTPKD